MDMGSGHSGKEMGMVPYFHFTGGDYLLLKAWAPTSPGAIAGACIALAFLAVFDRWVAASRGILDSRWRHKGLALVSRPASSSKLSLSPSNESTEKYPQVEVAEDLTRQSPNRRAVFTRTRTIPPFILAHDVPRGFMHASQALLAYILMLAVMTFNASYVFSIVLGLGIGEALFGRMGNGRGAGH